MNAQTLLDDLQSRGVKLEANGDRLRISAPPGTVTDELRDLLTRHKQELLQALPTPLQQEALACLEHNASAKYGIATKPGPDGVLVAVAIRNTAVCTLRIPADRWDPWLFMRLLTEEHAA